MSVSSNNSLICFIGINYLWVATHELGHILGLEHDTTTRTAVMYPYYRAYDPNANMKLHSNDIRRIRALYGKGTGGGATNPPVTQAPITQPPATQPPITQRPTQAPPGNFHNVFQSNSTINITI